MKKTPEKNIEKNRIKKSENLKDKNQVKNREFAVIAYVFIFIFILLAGYYVFFLVAKSDIFINNPYNKRINSLSRFVTRGDIISADGKVLATTEAGGDGEDIRKYPYGKVFSHVVGYSENGGLGIERDHNFELLRSHDFILTRIISDISGGKSAGDTVFTTLDCDVQKAAYDALGDRRGAVVVMEVATGKILAEVSKPDFDPNTIVADYEDYVGDATSSVLLNRAVNGLYPPGSVFKIVTALSYMRAKPGDYKDYSYECTGSLAKGDGSYMHCYGNEVHGMLDLKSSFARSCNTSFASMGLSLDLKKYRSDAVKLLFNKKIKADFDISKSSFVLNKNSNPAEVAETAIGQGETLVTPMHMCLIASAIKNKGVLMTPYVIDRVESVNGAVVRQNEPSRYKRLMTKDEAKALRELMNETVATGTGRKLSGHGYSAGGKTGSAEYSTGGASHGWFAGYASKKGYEDIAIAVIVEDGNTGSASAVPVAEAVLKVYFGE